jgi:hypothetical protein
MILIDFNQLFFSAIMSTAGKDVNSENPEGASLIRHIVLSAILSYKKKYGKKYGDVVLACDSREYWRRNVFPQYKANRKKDRDNSKADWPFIFQELDKIKVDLKENFPYKIIEVDGAEADDVIAIIAKYTQTNELVRTGLIDEPEPVMIISADTDFCQLQKWKNIEQFSPIQKKVIKPPVPLNEFIIDHVCGGDAGDGIPNICSPDNCFTDSIRQTPFKRIRLIDFNKRGIDACLNESERRNFQRNMNLIHFDFIPNTLEKKIINTYVKSDPVKSKGKIFKYLVKHGMKHLIASADSF